MARFELGQKVRVTKLVDRSKSMSAVHWISVPVAAREGIVIGRRKVQDGTIESEDGYRYFAPHGATLQYWLVATSLNRNPLRVPDDGIEEVS